MRITAALADARNHLVRALADRIFVAHAAPGSRPLTLCQDLQAIGKPVLTNGVDWGGKQTGKSQWNPKTR